MSVNSPQFAPNMMYYSPSAVKKRKAGATIFGGLLGMTAYYLPVTKDEFVNKAFKVTKAEANSKIFERSIILSHATVRLPVCFLIM